MTFEQALAVAQVLLVGLNLFLVPLAFSGVRWVISVERRLAEISVKLGGSVGGEGGP